MLALDVEYEIENLLLCALEAGATAEELRGIVDNVIRHHERFKCAACREDKACSEAHA